MIKRKRISRPLVAVTGAMALMMASVQGAIVVSLTDAPGGGIRVLMNGSADFSSLSRVNTILAADFVANQQFLGIGRGSDRRVSFASSGVAVTSPVYDSFSTNITSSGDFPHFGLNALTSSVLWDPLYVNNSELSVDETVSGVSLSDFIGSGGPVQVSTATWNSGSESLTMIVGATQIPEPSSAMLGLMSLSLLARRSRNGVRSI